MYRVTFLLDPVNSWLLNYMNMEFWANKHPKFTFNISHDALISNQDIIFILGYTKILPESFLRRNKLCLVVHESNLPEGKGFAPVQWQILEGKNTINVCLLEAAECVDSGDIYLGELISLSGFELYDEIREKQATTTFKLIDRFLEMFPEASKKKQDGKETFYPKRNAEDSELDINKTIKEQFNLLRVCNNEKWPAYFFVGNQKYILKIYKSE